MAEIAYSTEHAHREVLAWSQVTLCWYVCLNFTMKALAAAALGVRWSNVMVMLWLHYGYVVATAMAAASVRRGCVTAAASVRREQTRLQHLWLLRSPSRLSAHASPTLGSVNSEDSGDGKTIGITDRISETSSVLCFAIMKLELCILHWSIISCVS